MICVWILMCIGECDYIILYSFNENNIEYKNEMKRQKGGR